MQVSREIASRIVCFQFGDLPQEAIRSAKIAILDTLGVALAGSREKATVVLSRALGEAPASGSSVVFGTTQRTTCLDAALINGTAAHALDFDDVSDAMGGHPSAPVLAALFALGDKIDASGQQILTAFTAGFETEIRIAKAVNFHHYNKGWHPTATIGVFGAAAACARLLNLNCQQASTALSLSASMASGLKANFGTMTKPLHVGTCARSGLLAALLASEGFTAAPDGFEHKQGFLNVFNGPGTFDASKIFDHWANPLAIVRPGVAVKQYPCCASTHSAVDAMLQIVHAHRIDPESVSKIHVWIHERRLEHTNRPDPATATAAKFSLQYCLARALMDRKVVLEHFEGQAFSDKQARSIMERIEASPYSADRFDLDNAYGAEVRITLQSGVVHSAKLEGALSQSGAHLLQPTALTLKFENCAGRVLDRERLLNLQKAVDRLEELPSICNLTALTVPDPTRPI
jgi:2-methylcitrate dehydratase PrpD